MELATRNFVLNFRAFLESRKNLFVYLTFTYPIGIGLGVLFTFLRLIGFIKVKHPERFPHDGAGKIVCSNHPSFYFEAIMLAALFFMDYFWHPLRCGPWSTPDKANFLDKWFFFWLKPRAIAVSRGNTAKENSFMLRLIKTARSGGNLILFPEGGRTSSADNHLVSPKGNRIRSFKNGLGLLATASGSTILPVWVEGSDKVFPNKADRRGSILPRFWKGPIVISIGRPLKFERREDPSAVKCRLEEALLNLADED